MNDERTDRGWVSIGEAAGNVIEEVARKMKERVPRDPPLPPNPDKQHLERLRATGRDYA